SPLYTLSLHDALPISAPNPKAPMPDFSNRASLDIQYAWAIRSFGSKFFPSSSSQGKLAGFQCCAKDRSKALNICSFFMVQFPGKILSSGGFCFDALGIAVFYPRWFGMLLKPARLQIT